MLCARIGTGSTYRVLYGGGTVAAEVGGGGGGGGWGVSSPPKNGIGGAEPLL